MIVATPPRMEDIAPRRRVSVCGRSLMLSVVMAGKSKVNGVKIATRSFAWGLPMSVKDADYRFASNLWADTACSKSNPRACLPNAMDANNSPILRCRQTPNISGAFGGARVVGRAFG